MRFPDFQFDRVSFWLGFVAATLFWWILSTIRPMLPRLREQIRQAMQAFKQRNLAGAEEYLLRETLCRAQHMHLAASLFALDEIVITPRLVAPPPRVRPDSSDSTAVPIAAQVLPYLPDWPELTCPLGAPTITLAQAIQRGSPIAIIGQPGSGKTVALAHLAAQISRPAPPWMMILRRRAGSRSICMCSIWSSPWPRALTRLTTCAARSFTWPVSSLSRRNPLSANDRWSRTAGRSHRLRRPAGPACRGGRPGANPRRLGSPAP